MQKEESIQSAQSTSAPAPHAARPATPDQPIATIADSNEASGFDSFVEAWAREPERWDGLE